MTTATHAGFLSRATLGMRPPKSISRNIDAARGGCALHYGGDNVPIASHAQCIATWLSWQRFHMDSRGWADLAYTLGVCQHGYVFAGRGAGLRTAANGSNDGNLRFYAIVWIGGARQTPTALALAAIDWAIAELRRLGAGDRVVRHADLNSTGCPGDPLGRHARLRDRQPIRQQSQDAVPPATPIEQEYEMKRGDRGGDVRKMQERLIQLGHYTGQLDGDFGPQTEAAVLAYQQERRLEVTGRVSLWTAVDLQARAHALGSHR
ncbi:MULTISPECIES: N-acetylmuramoyl-L-alanine amidase [unclassified Egicoccus]|uniref:peptidoglycan recognition protein family protein n=1 Tax=unclassified Egicoccus TaxID=2635606 RepID=UPI00359D3BAD